jgi:hypothetical protein
VKKQARDRKDCLMLAFLHLRCKKASIDRQGEIARLGEIERVTLCLLICTVVSTFGA